MTIPRHYLRIMPPNHPYGAKGLWYWEVLSEGDTEMSGTSDDRQDAIDQATTALDEVTEASK